VAFGMAAHSGSQAIETSDESRWPTEADLIDAARHDPLAFAPLYNRYFPAIHGYCLRRIGHPESAADATSQIFINALQALSRFRPDRRRPGSSFRSWLFSIAHNVIVDFYRQNRITDHIESDLPTLVDSDPLPDELAVVADTSRQLHVALRHLPEVQRSIIELRLSGLKRAEIADVLNMTDPAVRSAQARAFIALRERLTDFANQPEQTHDAP
jgi:RNA polymerase sigma-70 factor (ECF subfamily)